MSVGCAMPPPGRGFAIRLESAVINSVVIDPADSWADIIVDTDGFTYQRTVEGGTVQLDRWLYSGKAEDYQIHYILVSGSEPDRGTGPGWFPLNVTRSWGLTRTTPGTSTGVWRMQIRKVGDTVTLDGALYEVTAEVDVG